MTCFATAAYRSQMAALREITSIRDIATDYDAVLCDAWGVIHDGRHVFDGVAEALTTFRRDHGPVVILTNAPKPADVIAPQLDRLGLPRDAYDGIVTSGEVTRSEISKRCGQKAFRIGWTSDAILYEGLDLDFVAIDDADFILCTGLAEEYGAAPEDYKALLEPAAAAKKEMICANPDIVVRWQGKLMYCAGAIAREYEALGGPVTYAGKPYPAVYTMCADIIASARRRSIDKPESARILAIGDGAGTDILGANRFGVDSLYVVGAGGVHKGGADLADVDAALRDAGATATYFTRQLRW
ncbi:MAG: TIGR01459 family HAD-type hydrolase [Pseudomonadota bacterium]